MSKQQKKRQRTEKVSISDDLEAAPPLAPGVCRPGSIEQHLDMCEKGPHRGDSILHHHGMRDKDKPNTTLNDRHMEENFHFDMSEPNREGDEESGDEHSSGLQADDQQEFQYDTESPEHADSGLPGEMTEKLAHRDPTRRGYRRRAA
jgi:hypothetical protein